MMFKSNGQRTLAWTETVLLRFIGALRRRMLVHVKVDDRGHNAIFLCETEMDANRPISLWIKEKGTMEWIEDDVRHDDVFMDIGANIGIYSIAAALRMGEAGKVYAFEPHKVNALSLLRNIQANNLGLCIEVFSCALSNRDGMVDFNYASLASASTASQLGHSRVPGTPHEFSPVAREKMYSTSVDCMLERGEIRAPTLVKIDVDGNEFAILTGMTLLLRSPRRPRTVQIELNVGEQDRIVQFMNSCGYELSHRHLTLAGKKAQALGASLEEVAHNALFRPTNKSALD
jgi:FkbM family methyltransferase